MQSTEYRVPVQRKSFRDYIISRKLSKGEQRVRSTERECVSCGARHLQRTLSGYLWSAATKVCSLLGLDILRSALRTGPYYHQQLLLVLLLLLLSCHVSRCEPQRCLRGIDAQRGL